MKLINRTSRTIYIYDDLGSKVLAEIPTTAPSISSYMEPEEVMQVSGVPVLRHRFNLDHSLPPEKDGVIYIVGWAVLLALDEQGRRRRDLIAPDTSRESAVRGGNGQIIGVRSFRIL